MSPGSCPIHSLCRTILRGDILLNCVGLMIDMANIFSQNDPFKAAVKESLLCYPLTQHPLHCACCTFFDGYVTSRILNKQLSTRNFTTDFTYCLG